MLVLCAASRFLRLQCRMPKAILVVEDDSDMRALIDRHLLGAGYAVRAVAKQGLA